MAGLYRQAHVVEGVFEKGRRKGRPGLESEATGGGGFEAGRLVSTRWRCRWRLPWPRGSPRWVAAHRPPPAARSPGVSACGRACMQVGQPWGRRSSRRSSSSSSRLWVAHRIASHVMSSAGAEAKCKSTPKSHSFLQLQRSAAHGEYWSREPLPIASPRWALEVSRITG